MMAALRGALPTEFNRYHEPFVGGGALFFDLAREGRPTGWATLTDKNLRLIRTWKAVQNNLVDLLERLREHEARHGPEHYYATRALPVDAEVDDAAVAAWFIYLNKTGFNGLYRVNSKGGFNVPFGRMANPNIRDEDNLRACHALLQGVELLHDDYTSIEQRAAPGDLVYLDPPYVPLSATSHFTAYTSGGFGPTDQQALAAMAHRMWKQGVKVVLSNHDTTALRALYVDFDLRFCDVARTISRDGQNREAVGELIICGY